nr:MAG TPA_asm: hypothetical protein [Caudoviricetes sp.]
MPKHTIYIYYTRKMKENQAKSEAVQYRFKARSTY